MEYKLLGAKDNVSLSQAVSKMLHSGWKLCGVPFQSKGNFYQGLVLDPDQEGIEAADIPQGILDEISRCIYVVSGECAAIERMGISPEFQKGEIAGFKTAFYIFGYRWDGRTFSKNVKIGAPRGGVLASKMQEFLSIVPDTAAASDYASSDREPSAD